MYNQIYVYSDKFENCEIYDLKSPWIISYGFSKEVGPLRKDFPLTIFQGLLPPWLFEYTWPVVDLQAKALPK